MRRSPRFLLRSRRAVAFVAIASSVALLTGLAGSAGAVQTPQSVVVSDNPADFTPNIVDPEHAGYHVEGIAQVGNEIYVGGEFTQVQNAGGGQIYNVTNLFAFNATTGQIDTSFFPQVNGRVDTVEAGPNGHSVYIGGAFNTVNGQDAKHFALVDTATGDPEAGFHASVNDGVEDAVLNNGKVYIGGYFTSVNGQARGYLAALDATTGAVDADVNLSITGSRPSSHKTRPTSLAKLDVTPDGSRLVIVGNFTNVNASSPARNQIALINLTTSPASVANWETERYVPACSSHFSNYIRDVDFSPDGSYFVVATTGATAIAFGGTPLSGPLCDSSARWETSATGTALQPTWVDHTGGDTNYSVAITGTAVYLGGHQRWQNNYWGSDSLRPGGVRRAGIAAVSPLNGIPFSWNPTRVRGLGAQALLATTDGLYVGSDTDTIGHEYHAKIALMPVAGGEQVPAANPGTLPGELYTVQQDGTMVARSFNGSSFGSPVTRTALNWSSIRGAFMLSGWLYSGWSDGHLYRRTLKGDAVGSQRDINLHGLESETQQSPGMSSQLSNATGMFWDPSNGRLYYTVSGDTHLYWRYFLPESNLVGAYRHTACTWSATPASNTCGGLNPSIVRGLTLTNGTLYFGQSTGVLSAVSFTSGTTETTNGVIGATATPISGPLIDGNNWNSRALFVRSDG